MIKHDDLVNAIVGDVSRTLRRVDAGEVEALAAALLAAERVFLAGKGRTGLQMRAFAMRLMHLGLTVYVVDDVTTPALGPDGLLLIGSSSGRTGSLQRYVETVGATGARLATLTGNLESPIASAADCRVYIPASNFKAGGNAGEESVLVMGSLFEHCLGLLCDLLIIRLKAALKVDEVEMNARHANLE
jgi:6-phospho-3-hexuloisomerase